MAKKDMVALMLKSLPCWHNLQKDLKFLYCAAQPSVKYSTFEVSLILFSEKPWHFLNKIKINHYKIVLYFFRQETHTDMHKLILFTLIIPKTVQHFFIQWYA